jgi:hypothetical protein
LRQQEWKSVEGNFPTIAPTKETKQIKNSLLTSFCNKIGTASGNWKDKSKFFMAAFKDIVPAANAQAMLAILDFNNYNTNVFNFTDLEPLDGNFHTLNAGNAADYPALTRNRTRYFHFALTVETHQHEKPEPQHPPLPFTDNDDRLHTSSPTKWQTTSERHKNIINTTPKLLSLIYNAAGQEFLIVQNRHTTQLQIQKSKTGGYKKARQRQTTPQPSNSSKPYTSED